MKNKLMDLNNHLFAQIERLSDEDLTLEQAELECRRSESIVDLSDQVIKIANLHLKAAKMMVENSPAELRPLLPMLSKAD